MDNTFYKQWLVTKRALENSDVERYIAGEYTFYFHNLCYIDKIKLGKGELFIIGPYIDLYNSLAGLTGQETIQEILFATIYLVGNYTGIIISDDEFVIFGDPSGSAPVYYNNAEASSNPLLLEECTKDIKSYEKLIPRYREWLPAPVSGYLNINVLMANHSFSVKRNTLSRYWPIKDHYLEEEISDINIVKKDLIEMTDLFFSKLKKYENLIVSLTGGKDSRVNAVMVAEKELKSSFFTVVAERVPKGDKQIPKRIAHELKLNYEQLPVGKGNDKIVSEYNWSSGNLSIGDRIIIMQALEKFYHSDNVHLTGHLGAIGSCFQWESMTPSPMTCEKFKQIVDINDDSLDSGIEKWIESVSQFSAPMQNDLYYLEQRGGRWGSPGEMGSKIFFENISFYSNRKLMELATQIPIESRFHNKIMGKLIVNHFNQSIADIKYTEKSIIKKILPLGVINILKRIRSFL